MLTFMRLFPLALLLFPFIDVFTAFAAVAAWQWAAVAWLAFAALVGIALLRRERSQFGPRLQGVMRSVLARGGASHQSGGAVLREVFRAAGTLIAALLLIFPGLASDAFAVVILLFAWIAAPNVSVPPPDSPIGADGVIEADYRLVPDSQAQGMHLPAPLNQPKPSDQTP